jgi:hypothetical protein
MICRISDPTHGDAAFFPGHPAYIAVTVPYFADWMELLGALGNGVLQVAVPIAIWLKLYGWEELEYGKLEQAWIVFILTFSAAAAIIGTCDAFGQLYEDIIGR